eukprot:TRINITY_DN14432_c0_g1_i1.p1 TRINITY_DN14432_c0_g1~~TRINITY_DN14432_c0_g1_i1.p1  ORF type:complete len:375 (-),score=66.13 TRINITY_DN14432_c0_g1_i1:493-1617(-)
MMERWRQWKISAALGLLSSALAPSAFLCLSSRQLKGETYLRGSPGKPSEASARSSPLGIGQKEASGLSAACLVGCASLTGFLVALRKAQQRSATKSSRVDADFLEVDSNASMWHHVELCARDWLDRETGLFNYVNEIPRWSLQKYEIQTQLPLNVIGEDATGSERLRTFGQPVPFNYGCFPQTWRDPRVDCDTHGALGDNDPLDVIELTPESSGVGTVVRCRPIGAVCLIDEGKADWKILVVNVDFNGPLASARSPEEVEKLWPGRIAEVLAWVDGFKRLSGSEETKLHFKVHDANRALNLIDQDHTSWKRLIDDADSQGTSHGLWIRYPDGDWPRLVAEDLEIGTGEHQEVSSSLSAADAKETQKDPHCMLQF